LNHIAGVNPTGKSVVEPWGDHPPQSRAVPLPKRIGRRGIAFGHTVQQVLCLAGIWPDQTFSIPDQKNT
jgi:hypothetical protein